MKAWQLSGLGLDHLVLNDIAKPEPGPGEVLVRIFSVSLNYRDKLIYDGDYNAHIKFPITQVADAVGEVVGLGPDVSRFQAGDRVITNYCTRWIDGAPASNETYHTLGSTIPGALAEYLVLDEKALVTVPAYLTDDEAATLPCAALTAWYSLVEKGQLTAHQTVLVQGTGGVSLFGLQIASALGAEVIVTSSSEEKLARVRALGAKHTINYALTPDWEKEALALTNQQGVDHILEVVGGRNLARSLEALKPGGQISIIGILDGFSAELPLVRTIRQHAVLRGISVGPRRALEDMLRKLDEIKLHPIIEAVYSFDDAHAAFDHLERGAFGKIVIRVRA
jgi:NADPH:quinone reductase-like Zn-dependent oxidoreductase